MKNRAVVLGNKVATANSTTLRWLMPRPDRSSPFRGTMGEALVPYPRLPESYAQTATE